jgi:hypothetical protein
MKTTNYQIQYKFKLFENIVCLHDGFLYQLEHCPKKRTKVFRKLTFNSKRNAFYINGQLVTRKRLGKLKYATL